jgi:Flp pilus assembly protein TadG
VTKVGRICSSAWQAFATPSSSGVLRDRAGTSAVEFALIAPALMLLALGTVQFGLTINNFITLTDAVRTASRQLAVSRGGATPYTDTVNQVYRSAPTLTQASLTISLTVNGTACSTDTACASALTSAQGQPASVSAAYPCDLSVFGYDFAPGCILSSQTTERIE